MEEDSLLKNKIKSLLLKGFDNNEIGKLLNIPDDKVMKIIEEIDLSDDIKVNSVDYYSDLQKDLSKLVYSELNKESRDSNVILTAIKLQASLQEKKLFLGKQGGGRETRISHQYIYERDNEIKELKELGKTDEEIAKELEMAPVSVYQANDRNALELSDALKMKLSPSIVTETKGLDLKRRMDLLQKAYDEDLTRAEVRKLRNEIKNESR